MKFNEVHITEGLDRLHVINEMIDSFLVEHPAVIKANCSGKVKQAQKLLYDCYQDVAALEDL